MKKKLLLFLTFVAVMTCIFAISSLAAEIPDWTDITTVDGMPDKSVFGADGTKGATSRVLMSDGITYPAYYICNNSDSLGFNYKDLNSKTGKSYAAKDVVRLEVPKGTVKAPQAALKTANGYTALLTVSLPEGFTTLNGYTFYGSSTAPSVLVKVDFPSTLKTMGQNEFIDCIALEELIIPEGVTTIPKEFAKNATSLKKVVLPSTIVTIKEGAFRSCDLSDGIVIPNGCKTIEKYAFKGTNIPRVDIFATTLESALEDSFAECKSLTYVYSESPVIGYKMFYSCPNIETVILKNTITIDSYAFCNPNGGTTNISTLVLPEGLKSIGTYAFTRNSLTEVVLPSTLETIGSSAFIKCLSLKKIVVLGSIMGENMFHDCSNVNELVLTEKFVTLSKNALGNVSQTSFITYYTGTDYERIKSVCSSTTRLSQGKYYTYEDYINGDYTYNKFMVIYDVNLCVAAFDGVHTEPQDDGDCTTAVTCSMCKEHTFKEALQHTIGEKITYTSFLEVGEYYNGCTNDGCTVGTTEETKALFAFLGYSVAEFGNGGMMICFSVDKDAVAKYEQVTGDTVKYGLFAASQKKLGAADIFDSNGNAAGGVINADITAFELDIFELKITGLTDENKGARLAIGAYVAVMGEGGVEYSYLQSSAPASGEKYYFVSYNDVLDILK